MSGDARKTQSGDVLAGDSPPMGMEAADRQTVGAEAVDIRTAGMEAAMAAVARGVPAAPDRVFSLVLPLLQQLVQQQSALSYQERCDMIGKVSEWFHQELVAICRGFDPGKAPPRPYLRRVLRCMILRYLRSLTTHRHHMFDPGEGELEEQASSMPDGEAMLAGKDLQAVVSAFMAGRDPLDQLIFEERILGSATSRALGAALGLQPDAIDQRVKRLKSSLQTHLMRLGLIGLMWVLGLAASATVDLVGDAWRDSGRSAPLLTIQRVPDPLSASVVAWTRLNAGQEPVSRLASPQPDQPFPNLTSFIRHRRL